MSTPGTPQPEQQPQQPQVTAMTEGTQPPVASAPQPAQQQPSSGTMMDKVLGALSGHPQKYAIDPATGQQTGTPETDRGTLAKHIVAAALVGLFKGVQQRGPGSLARAAGAGGEAGMQLGAQQDAVARQDAQGDYQRQQDIATQKANALEKNLRMRNLAQSLADADEKTHQTIVGNYAEQLQRTKDESPESILAEGIPEHEAKDPTKYSLMDQRVPDGVVPKLGPNGQQEKDADGVPQWEQTYTVVDQHSKSTISGAQWVKDANEWGIPGSKSLISASAGTQLTNVAQNHYIHQLGQLQTMQSEMDGFAKKLGIPAIDLKSKVQADPSLIEAVNQFQRTSGASTQPDAQIDAMRGDPKAAPFVNRVMGLFGADNLEQFKQNRVDEQAKAKAQAEQAGKTAAETSPAAIQGAAQKAGAEANAKLAVDSSPRAIAAAGAKSASEAKAKAAVDDTPVVAYDPTYENSDGTKGGNVVMTRGEADTKQMPHYKVNAEKINSTVAGFNDVQNKINMLAAVTNDPKRMGKVSGPEAAVLLKNGFGLELGAFGTKVDLSNINTAAYEAHLKWANQATKDYVVAMGAAHEAITQLPRLQTFGQSSRMTEQQMLAAQKMLPQPGDAADPKQALAKMRALQTTLDPLRKQLPHMAGAQLLPSWLEKGAVMIGDQPTVIGH